MAKFSQAFLQGLLQPTYQKGLFEAARGIGMAPRVMQLQKEEKAEREQLSEILSGPTTGSAAIQRVAQLNTLAQQARMKGNTQRAIAIEKAAANLQSQIRMQGAGQIAELMQQLDRAVDPTNISNLQDQINTLARDTMQTDPTKFVGLGSKRKEKVVSLLEDQSEMRVENYANALARSSIEDVVAHIDALPEQSVGQDGRINGFTDREKAELTKQVVDLRKIRDGHLSMLKDGNLSSFYKDILKNNKELRESPEVQRALDILERKKDPDSSVTAGEAKTAADAIRSAVQAEYGRQQTIDRSTNRLEAKADRMVDALLEEGGISEWVYGEDLVEVVERVKDDEDLADDFRSFIAQEIEKNPDVDKNLAIKTALDLLGEKHDLRLEEGRQANVEEKRQEAADREAAIVALMEREDLSRKDAIRKLNSLEAERVMQRVGEQSTSRTSFQ
jgi:hypothetical protein|tara:strand:+ start:54 stop:1391 length:1338 start_codon:yes stop_codon:yes gene_type:complete